MLDITKHNRSTIGGNKWKANGGCGTFCYPPGFGKTRAALLIAKSVLTKYPDKDILILVPSVAIREMWLDAIRRIDEKLEFTPEEISRFVIETPISARNNILYGTEFTLQIVDEIHKFVGTLRYALLRAFSHKSILGLTGTFPTGLNGILLSKICPVIDTITETEALSQNWISQFREYNIECVLTDEDKERYEKFSIPIASTLEQFKGMSKRIVRQDGSTLFKSDYHAIQSCKSGLKTMDALGRSMYISADDIRSTVAAYMEWTPRLDLSTEFGKDRDDMWNPTHIKETVLVFTDFVDKRNRIIINNVVKLNKVAEIYKKFPSKTICFNESTDFADAIANVINSSVDVPIAICYHSNIESRGLINLVTGDFYRYGKGTVKEGQIKVFGKTKLRDIALAGLADGTYSFLCTARALDEGVDIPSIEQVITTAGTANPTQYTQRGGRGKRVDIYNPNKVTKIFNLYFNDFMGSTGNLIRSRDKQKLISNQTERHSNVVWISDLSDISDL
jgi:superfamily II DNA or RNA helicase